MMSMITFDEVEYLAVKVQEARAKVAEIGKTKKEAEDELDRIENKVIEILEKLDKTSYQSKVGRVGITARTSVKLPATPEDKQKFFDYLREKGLFENMITVHSATLNSYYKAEFNSAMEKGEDFDIPGIGEPQLSKSLSFSQAK